MKRQTQTGIVYKFIEIFNNANFALNSSLRFLGQRDGVKYGSFQWYIYCVPLFLCGFLECPIENKSCVLKFWLITFLFLSRYKCHLHTKYIKRDGMVYKYM